MLPFDLVYPSALAGVSEPMGVLYPSFALAQVDQFVHHKKIVFLSTPDRTEIQRAATNKIPVLLQVHSLQSAFDVFKLSGVKAVLVHPDAHNPVIDVGWMQKAVEEKKSVVFSFPHFQHAVQHKHANTVQEYRKLARLLVAYKVPLSFASFATEAEAILPARAQLAWAHELGLNSLPAGWVL